MKRFSVSPANFYDWQRDARLFEGMALYRFRSFTLTGSGNAEAIVAGAVGRGANGRPRGHGPDACQDRCRDRCRRSALAFVALMASLVPAYRASRLDPSQVLRAS